MAVTKYDRRVERIAGMVGDEGANRVGYALESAGVCGTELFPGYPITQDHISGLEAEFGRVARQAIHIAAGQIPPEVSFYAGASYHSLLDAQGYPTVERADGSLHVVFPGEQAFVGVVSLTNPPPESGLEFPVITSRWILPELDLFATDAPDIPFSL